MRAGTAGVCGVPVRTKTFVVKSVKATVAAIVASAGDAAERVSIAWRALPPGGAPFLRTA